MKFGAAICGEKIPPPSKVAKGFYERGVNVVELKYDKRFDSKEIKLVKNFDLDLSVHCPCNHLRLNFSKISFLLNNTRFYFSKLCIKEMEKGFSVAERLEATHYVVHGGIFPKGYFKFKCLRQRDKLIKAFVKAFESLFLKSKNTGIKVVLENLTKGNLFSDVSDIKYVQEVYPWLGFCLDFAHSELTNQTNLLRNLKIDHVHLSDNDLISDSHLPLGTGKINFAKLRKILRQQDFDGKLITECPNIKKATVSLIELKKQFK